MALVQRKRSIADLINSDKTRLEIAKVLPKHLTPERMTRVALTATMRNPLLLNCNPSSLVNALLLCSQAGLEPDGRLAHLIPYKDQVQVIFDYKGLVTLALRNGAESVYADKVCEFDVFEAFVEDGIKTLNHRPNWSKPRGTATCYYAVCKRAGEVDWEVMTVEEVDNIRKRSRASNSGPWVTDYDEMAKKTVLRRMSKRWDLLPEIRDVINADDDTPALNEVKVSAPLFQPRPAVAALPDAEYGQPEHEQPQQPEHVEHEQAQPEHVERPSHFNSLRALRGLLAQEHINEGLLLDFWAASGDTDGSSSSVEEVQLSRPDLIPWCVEHWAEFLGRYRKAEKGQNEH